MSLIDILQEVLDIEEGMIDGVVSFTCDNLSSAMRYEHPIVILDSIISETFWALQEGKEPEKEKLDQVRKSLKRFQRSYKVKELSKPIKDLELYLGNIG